MPLDQISLNLSLNHFFFFQKKDVMTIMTCSKIESSIKSSFIKKGRVVSWQNRNSNKWSGFSFSDIKSASFIWCLIVDLANPLRARLAFLSSSTSLPVCLSFPSSLLSIYPLQLARTEGRKFQIHTLHEWAKAKQRRRQTKENPNFTNMSVFGVGTRYSMSFSLFLIK